MKTSVTLVWHRFKNTVVKVWSSQYSNDITYDKLIFVGKNSRNFEGCWTIVDFSFYCFLVVNLHNRNYSFLKLNIYCCGLGFNLPHRSPHTKSHSRKNSFLESNYLPLHFNLCDNSEFCTISRLDFSVAALLKCLFCRFGWERNPAKRRSNAGQTGRFDRWTQILGCPRPFNVIRRPTLAFKYISHWDGISTLMKELSSLLSRTK